MCEPLVYGGGKNILAPMVRVGTLPARLLALQYGADIVFCEEVIDHRILQCKRINNEKLGTVDFMLEEDTQAAPVFRTCPGKEKKHLVFQMGTSNAERALNAAKMVEDLVAGVDVNMGCPKAYSVKGGMGAALLSEETKVQEILSTLVKALSIPVTCKIRLLGSDQIPSLQKTREFMRACASTGIAAISVHGRTRDERSRDPNHDDVIAELADIAGEFGIPLIANGGSNVVKTHADISVFRERTKADSVMLARAAMWDLSIFRKEGPLPLDDIIRDYLRLCVRYENSTQNTKYVVGHMLQDQNDSPRGHALQKSATLREVCVSWDVESIYDEETEKLKCKEMKRKHSEEDMRAKKSKDDAEDDKLDETVIRADVKFVRKEYAVSGASPKSIVVDWTKKNNMELPSYETYQRKKDKFFKSILTLGEEKFTCIRWEKSKKFAEQSAALAFLTLREMKTGKRFLSSNMKLDPT